jgi:hypothetical protein
MIPIEIDGVRLNLATRFDAMRSEQLLELMPFVIFTDQERAALRQAQGDNLGQDFGWIEILRVLLKDAWLVMDGKPKAFKKFWNELQLDVFQFETLKEQVKWVLEPIDCKPLAFFEFEGVRYYFLEDRFKNVCAAEWTAGIIDFLELKENPNLIDLLVANFCRPERTDIESFRGSDKWNGDVREPYNRSKAEERAKSFERLNVAVKVLFLKWYQYLLTVFFDEYRELLGSGGGEKRYADGRGFVMILKNAAKAHYMGDFDKVSHEDVNLVYALLLDDYYDLLETKRKNG